MKITLSRLFYSAFSFILTFCLPGLTFAQGGQGSTAVNVLNPSQLQNGTDISVQYLADIFGVVDGVLHGSGSQIMGHMFAALNAGALALGGIIIMYTLIVSTLNTAHEGTPLGREWSSLWIPIRSAIGIALLLPKATGYSLIQIFMMWIVVQGVGLADSVWNNALLYIGQGGLLVQQELPPATNLSGTVGDILQSEVCMYGLQAALQQAYQDAINSKNPPTTSPVPQFSSTVTPISQLVVSQSVSSWPTCIDGTSPCVDFPGQSSAHGFSADYDGFQGRCGHVAWQSPLTVSTNQQIQQVYATAEVTAIQQMILDLSGPAQAIANSQLQLTAAQTGVTPPPVSTLASPILFGNTIEDFQGIMQPAVSELAGGGGATQATQAALLKQQPDGWVTAANLYSILTQANANLKRASNPTITTVAPSTADTSMGTNGQNLSPFTWSSSSYSQQVANLITATGAGSLNDFITNAITYTAQSYAYNGGNTGAPPSGGKAPSTGNKILDALPLVGPIISVATSFSNLKQTQQNNYNPVLAIATMGNSLIDLVVQVWLIGAGVLLAVTSVFSSIICTAFGTVVTTVVQWILPLLWGILGLLFVNGCVMAFYIPMIPFILFTFGALGWFFTVIEAMVAGPLIALGITHPEGKPVLGMADPALLIIVSVFIRPTTMVIGFIAGIIMSYVGVWLLNIGFFSTAVSGVIAPSTFSLSFIFVLPAILTIYTTLVILVLHESFNLIFIGDRIMRWLGAQGEQLQHAAEKALGEAKGGVSSGAGAFERDASQVTKDAMKGEGEGSGTATGGGSGGEGGEKPSKEEIQVAQMAAGLPPT